MMNLRRALALCVLLPNAALAHEHWLSPSDYLAVPGRPVAASARVGEGLCGPSRPYQESRTVRFIARAGRTLDLSTAAGEGDMVWTRFAPVDSGGVLVAWESGFVAHRMTAEKFDAYLESDGLDGPRGTRRAARDTSAGRERYRRCSKLWLTGSAPAGSRATSALGLPLEIVPRSIPGETGELAVEVQFRGAPLAGALVQAWHARFQAGSAPRGCPEERPAEPVWRGRTDAKGIVRVRCDEAGEWLIGTVHMVPCAAPEGADWESTWASLAFGRRVRNAR